MLTTKLGRTGSGKLAFKRRSSTRVSQALKRLISPGFVKIETSVSVHVMSRLHRHHTTCTSSVICRIHVPTHSTLILLLLTYNRREKWCSHHEFKGLFTFVNLTPPTPNKQMLMIYIRSGKERRRCLFSQFIGYLCAMPSITEIATKKGTLPFKSISLKLE